MTVSDEMYKPGSKQSKERGCTCLAMENYYGAGLLLSDGGKRFWIDRTCPLHFKPKRSKDYGASKL